MFPGLVMIYLFHLIQPSQTIETSWTPRLTWLLCHHINITPSLHYNIIISILVCWSPQQVVDGGLGDGSKNPPITNLQNHCQEIFKEKTCKKYIFVGEYNFLFWRKKLRQLHRMGGTLPQQHWQTEKWTSCGFFLNFHFFMVQYCSVVEQFSVCILW